MIGQRTSFENINGDIWLAKNKIDGKVVLEKFLKKYNFVAKDDVGGPSLNSEEMIAYIERRINETQ